MEQKMSGGSLVPDARMPSVPPVCILVRPGLGASSRTAGMPAGIIQRAIA
jgi:hypothetical protein